jgi:hypothetical protein
MFNLGRRFYIGLAVWVIAVLCHQGWLPAPGVIPFSQGYNEPHPYLGKFITVALYIVALRLSYVFLKWVMLGLVKRTLGQKSLFEISLVLAVVALLGVLPSRAETIFIVFKSNLLAHVADTIALIKPTNIAHNYSNDQNHKTAAYAAVKPINQALEKKIHIDVKTVIDIELAILYDFGYAVPSLIYNAAGQQRFWELGALCQEKEGGFIKKLDTHWFLCKRLH